MSDSQRLESILVELQQNMSQLANNIGLKNNVKLSYINTGRNGFSADMAKLICDKYNQFNYYWILKGEGDMLKTVAVENSTEQNSPAGKLIPFYDADAAAGYDYGMTMEPARQVGMIEIGSILKDSEAGIRVYGNSMIPNYPAGCVIGTKLHTDSFIEPGRVYVVETRDNRYLKRLYYNDDKSGFHCISDNPIKYDDGPRKGKLYYQDFEIPTEEVVRIHRVVGVIKRNIL